MSIYPILSAPDSADLRRRNLLCPGAGEASLRLHKRLLNVCSDEDNQGISLNVSCHDPAHASAFDTIPEFIICRQTLIWIGFSELKATEIWHDWANNWPGITAPFLRRETGKNATSAAGGDKGTLSDGILRCFLEEFALPHIRQVKDVCDGCIEGMEDDDGNEGVEDDDGKWFACLDACGIGDDLQERIMDPLFKEIRLWDSCLFWVEDSIRGRFRSLKSLREMSGRRDVALWEREKEREKERERDGSAKEVGNEELAARNFE